MKYRLQFNRSKRDCKWISKQKIQGTGTISAVEGESKEGTNTDRLSQADHIHWTACGCSLPTAEKLVGDKDGLLVDPGLQVVPVSFPGSPTRCWRWCQRSRKKSTWEPGGKSPLLFQALQFSFRALYWQTLT